MRRLLTTLHLTLGLLAFWLISGTLLNLTKHPHWYIRGWDFPRVFVAILAAAVGVPLAIWFHGGWQNLAILVGLAFVIVRQLWLIRPYTRLARKSVEPSTKPAGDDSFRLVISNLLQENDAHDPWRRTILAADPDVVVAVEVSTTWQKVLDDALAEKYPHRIARPQENYYGMAVFSRLPFAGEPELRFTVQDDIPSIHLTLKLRDGQEVRLHALHPRPPEPLRNQDSAPRDAELVLLGKEIGKDERHIPTVVCGDLNDVAWSYTTQLFLRLSRLLDPRRGRGQFSSYNAKSRIFRFPLDHVFHSDEFELIALRVLPFVGSDHFPMFIELRCAPCEATARHEEPKPTSDDHQAAEEIVQEQAKR